MRLKQWTQLGQAHVRRLVKARELRVLVLRPGLRRARHVVVMVVQNEAPRLAAFLTHHRKLGFEHFIIVDNRSEDGLRDDVAAMEDVSLFSAEGAYGRARFGNDWVNTLLSRYCCGKWILYVDADEHFVFPCAEQGGIGALTAFLEAHRQVSLPCIMVDMYSDRPVVENICAVGQDPVEVCRLYDRAGYVEHVDPHTGIRWVKGGVRGRMFFEADLWKGPALNKTPLVLWRRSYAFLKSSHELFPPGANQPVDTPMRLRGALLHFKFLSTLTDLLAREAQQRQHTAEYRAYAALNAARHAAEPSFVCSETAHYVDWRSLADDGLIVGTDWPVATAADDRHAAHLGAA